MVIFESDIYTALTLFADTEAGVTAKITLTDGMETQTRTAVGRCPITFSLKSDTTYTLQSAETDVRAAYLHGGEQLAEKGIRFLQINNRKYTLHFAPPIGWVGGPSAIFRKSGMYHVFYLWNPFGENSETLYWGHAAGESLTKLRPMPIAAMPPEELQISRYRCGGALGGTVMTYGDKTKLFYTQCIMDQAMRCISVAQMESVSRDLLYFSEAEPVLAAPEGYCPKVTGDLLTLCGSFHGKGAVYAYTGQSGEWKKQGILLKDAHNPYLHCAEFFPLGRTHALLTEGEDGVVRWTVGTYADGKFRKREAGISDMGAFNMPCTVSDGEERLLMGCIGHKALSLPRRVFMKNGSVCTKPTDAVREAFRKETAHSVFWCCMEGESEDAFSAAFSSFRIETEKDKSIIRMADKKWVIHTHARKMEVFADGDIIEIFINDGEVACSFLSDAPFRKERPIVSGERQFLM